MSSREARSRATRSANAGPATRTLQPRRPRSVDARDIDRRGACPCGGGCPRCRPSEGACPSSTELLIPPGPGRGLEPDLRRGFERRFGGDLGRVRIHTGGAAAAAARRVRARAYTLGNDMVFGAGQYRPGSIAGRWILAHELAHVAQQSPRAAGDTSGAVERDARRSATAAVLGLPARPRARHDGRRLRRFGQPEHVPELTYISTQGRQGFLNQAVAYHRAWGLTPIRVDSLEDVVNHLARGRARLGRIRIVTHAAQAGMYLSLFRRQPLVSLTGPRLAAWSSGDVPGLEFDVGYPFGHLNVASAARILSHLRRRHAAMLTPFRLQRVGTPTGALARLFQRATDLELSTQARTAANAVHVDPVITALGTILADIRTRVMRQGRINAAAAQALETAVRGAGLRPQGFVPSVYRGRAVREANRAVTANFRMTLGAARRRFDTHSWIDIRGCNAGSRRYVQAVRRFFGRPGHLPHASAPDWFQQFLLFGFGSLANDRAIDRAYRSRAFRVALTRWSRITGINNEYLALRLFYRTALLQRQQLRLRAALARRTRLFGRGPGSGAGGLFRTPGLTAATTLTVPTITLPFPPRISAPADRLLVQMIVRGSLTTSLRPPAGASRFSLVPNLALADPLEGMIRRALRVLELPSGEARYFFHSPHVLPVYRARDRNFRFYYLGPLRELAFDRWLDSQWTSAAPNLNAIKRQAATLRDSRRIQALVPQRRGGLDRMLFPPDPRYWLHIVRV